MQNIQQQLRSFENWIRKMSENRYEGQEKQEQDQRLEQEASGRSGADEPEREEEKSYYETATSGVTSSSGSVHDIYNLPYSGDGSQPRSSEEVTVINDNQPTVVQVQANIEDFQESMELNQSKNQTAEASQDTLPIKTEDQSINVQIELKEQLPLEKSPPKKMKIAEPLVKCQPSLDEQIQLNFQKHRFNQFTQNTSKLSTQELQLNYSISSSTLPQPPDNYELLLYKISLEKQHAKAAREQLLRKERAEKREMAHVFKGYERSTRSQLSILKKKIERSTLRQQRRAQAGETDKGPDGNSKDGAGRKLGGRYGDRRTSQNRLTAEEDKFAYLRDQGDQADFDTLSQLERNETTEIGGLEACAELVKELSRSEQIIELLARGDRNNLPLMTSSGDRSQSRILKELIDDTNLRKVREALAAQGQIAYLSSGDGGEVRLSENITERYEDPKHLTRQFNDHSLYTQDYRGVTASAAGKAEGSPSETEPYTALRTETRDQRAAHEALGGYQDSTFSLNPFEQHRTLYALPKTSTSQKVLLGDQMTAFAKPLPQSLNANNQDGSKPSQLELRILQNRSTAQNIYQSVDHVLSLKQATKVLNRTHQEGQAPKIRDQQLQFDQAQAQYGKHAKHMLLNQLKHKAYVQQKAERWARAPPTIQAQLESAITLSRETLNKNMSIKEASRDQQRSIVNALLQANARGAASLVGIAIEPLDKGVGLRASLKDNKKTNHLELRHAQTHKPAHSSQRSHSRGSSNEPISTQYGGQGGGQPSALSKSNALIHSGMPNETPPAFGHDLQPSHGQKNADRADKRPKAVILSNAQSKIKPIQSEDPREALSPRLRRSVTMQPMGPRQNMSQDGHLEDLVYEDQLDTQPAKGSGRERGQGSAQQRPTVVQIFSQNKAAQIPTAHSSAVNLMAKLETQESGPSVPRAEGLTSSGARLTFFNHVIAERESENNTKNENTHIVTRQNSVSRVRVFDTNDPTSRAQYGTGTGTGPRTAQSQHRHLVRTASNPSGIHPTGAQLRIEQLQNLARQADGVQMNNYSDLNTTYYSHKALQQANPASTAYSRAPQRQGWSRLVESRSKSQSQQCVRSSQNKKRHYLQGVLTQFGCDDSKHSAIMSKMRCSPYIVADDPQLQADPRLATQITESSLKPLTSEFYGSFDQRAENGKRLLPQKYINTGLPQNKHTLINRKFQNELEETFIELKNCLNMKEFQKFNKHQSSLLWQKQAQHKGLFNQIQTLSNGHKQFQKDQVIKCKSALRQQKGPLGKPQERIVMRDETKVQYIFHQYTQQGVMYHDNNAARSAALIASNNFGTQSDFAKSQYLKLDQNNQMMRSKSPALNSKSTRLQSNAVSSSKRLNPVGITLQSQSSLGARQSLNSHSNVDLHPRTTQVSYKTVLGPYKKPLIMHEVVAHPDEKLVSAISVKHRDLNKDLASQSVTQSSPGKAAKPDHYADQRRALKSQNVFRKINRADLVKRTSTLNMKRDSSAGDEGSSIQKSIGSIAIRRDSSKNNEDYTVYQSQQNYFGASGQLPESASIADSPAKLHPKLGRQESIGYDESNSASPWPRGFPEQPSAMPKSVSVGPSLVTQSISLESTIKEKKVIELKKDSTAGLSHLKIVQNQIKPKSPATNNFLYKQYIRQIQQGSSLKPVFEPEAYLGVTEATAKQVTRSFNDQASLLGSTPALQNRQFQVPARITTNDTNFRLQETISGHSSRMVDRTTTFPLPTVLDQTLPAEAFADIQSQHIISEEEYTQI